LPLNYLIGKEFWREGTLADQPISQIRCNLAEFILADKKKKIKIWWEFILAEGQMINIFGEN